MDFAVGDTGERVFFNSSSQTFILSGNDWDSFVLENLASGMPINKLAEEIANAQSIPYTDVFTSISKLAGLSSNTVSISNSNQHIFRDGRKQKPLSCVVAGFRSFAHTQVFIGFDDQHDFQAFEALVGKNLIEASSSTGCDVLIERTGDGQFTVRTAGGEIESNIDLGLASLFAFNVTEDIAAKRKDSLFIAHAGAVYEPSSGVAAIFPALGHAGKSTLMCSLAMKQYLLINDDVVPVSRDGRLHSLSSIVKLRQGSWHLFDTPIQPYCTGIEFVNGDERLKLVNLANASDHDNKADSNVGFFCQYLIVPAYAPFATPSVQRISTVEALRAVVDAESIFHKPATVKDIDTILKWLDSLACYRIQYDTLAAAHRQIDDIFKVGADEH